MVNKRRRQAAVLELVRSRPVANQAELVRLLGEQGIAATQASVSRDVRELGLVKLGGRYIPAVGVREGGPAAGEHRPESELVTRIEPVGANLIIVRTKMGGANAVAVEIDRLTSDEIAGTLAGDDTIFVAVRSRAAQGRVVALLRSLIRPEPPAWR